MSCWSWGRLPARREQSQSTRPLGVSTRLPWSLRVTLEGLGRECALHCGTIGLAVDLGEPTVTTLPACSITWVPSKALMPTSLHPRDAHELAWAVALGIWVFKNSQVILM